MNLTIFETAAELELQGVLGIQIPELRWSDQSPTIGETITRTEAPFNWRVIHTESYQRDSDLIHLALIYPDHLPIPDRDEWSMVKWREQFDSPNLSLDIELSPSREWLESNLNLQGKAPQLGKRLYDCEPYYPDHPERTALRPIELPWQIDRIESYLPIDQGLVTAIHLCWCQAVPELAAA